MIFCQINNHPIKILNWEDKKRSPIGTIECVRENRRLHSSSSLSNYECELISVMFPSIHPPNIQRRQLRLQYLFQKTPKNIHIITNQIQLMLQAIHHHHNLKLFELYPPLLLLIKLSQQNMRK